MTASSPAAMVQPPLRVVIVGHVDHGKSTLIGRLLHDTGSLPDGKREEIEAVSRRRGAPGIEWSFVLDAFQAERDQNVTIDTTRIRFATGRRDYEIIDAPGHREFLRNMISGAAAADAAILVVDATEGVREQTRRHAYILHLLGLRQVAVAINKMDAAAFDPEVFNDVARQAESCLLAIGLTPTHIVPLSARDGDMIAARGERAGWYRGRTLVEVLDGFDPAPPPLALPLRFPVQDVYKQDGQRIIVGRVETGILRRGDTVLFSPGNEKAIVESIAVWPPRADKVEARAGEAVGITLSERIFVERGHVASHEKNPPMLSNVFRAHIFWLAERPLTVGDSFRAHIATHEAMVSVQSIDRVIDTDTLDETRGAGAVMRLAMAEVTLRAREMVPIDPHTGNPRTGRLVLYDGHDIAGGGTVNMDGYADQRRLSAPKSKNIHAVRSLLSPQERVARNGHAGGIFWLTGLSGAGKSTLAMLAEKALFDRGLRVYVLDGDNVRHGLNADLGFSPEDRAENIRRVGEVASLLADAGLVTITAFISPYCADRDRARAAAPERFHEIYIRADLETCESRDPKGLYRKARGGEISDFTGIDSPYEPPQNPELVVDTQRNDVDSCVRQIVDYVIRHTALSKKSESERDRA